MAKYKCVQRLTTDNHKTIHEVGEVVELSDQDAKVALQARAVVLVEDDSKAAPKGKTMPDKAAGEA